MRQYWQFEYFVDGKHKIRYFYGTEAAVNRRAKRYDGCGKQIKLLNKSEVLHLKQEKEARFIDL